jgi:hypothetical protein
MFAIDREIGIERQYGMPLMPSARYTHRRAISACLDISDMLVDAECDRERTILENPEQCILRPGETREQMHHLG